MKHRDVGAAVPRPAPVRNPPRHRPTPHFRLPWLYTHRKFARAPGEHEPLPRRAAAARTAPLPRLLVVRCVADVVAHRQPMRSLRDLHVAIGVRSVAMLVPLPALDRPTLPNRRLPPSIERPEAVLSRTCFAGMIPGNQTARPCLSESM